MKTTWVSAVLVGLVLAVAPMPAHHSFAAEFDGDKPVDLTGTVTQVEHGCAAKDGSHTLAARQITTPDGGRLFAGSPDSGPKQ